MSIPATPSPTPAGDEHNPVPATAIPTGPSFEDRVRLFWEKNSKTIIAVLVVILLVIVGQGAWEYLAEKKERDIASRFAAATTPAQVKAFIAEHPQHPLTGVAHLRMADEAYGQGKYADAVVPYEQAAAILQTPALASRARLGVAMAKLQGGRAAEGEAALKAFAADEKEIKAYRAEAAYHLTSLAASNGNATEVTTYSEQLMQLDPASSWTQRALQLRTTVPGAEAPAAPAPASDAPAIKLPGK